MGIVYSKADHDVARKFRRTANLQRPGQAAFAKYSEANRIRRAAVMTPQEIVTIWEGMSESQVADPSNNAALQDLLDKYLRPEEVEEDKVMTIKGWTPTSRKLEREWHEHHMSTGFGLKSDMNNAMADACWEEDLTIRVHVPYYLETAL